jgi:nucleoid-associated protein YgaU
MHSIERYGIVALLFLVVTVVAVLMWDGKKKPAPEALAATGPALGEAAHVDPPAARAAEAEGRRLRLVAASQPGPLARAPRTAAEPELDRPAQHEPASGPLESNLPEPASQETLEVPFAPRAAPAAEPAPAPAIPVLAEARSYTVRAGDTLSEIAERELGASRRWPELVAANPGLDPAKLRVGKAIRVPGAKETSTGGAQPVALAATTPPRGEAAAKPAPKSAPGKTWKVGRGENLWRIAERALGDGKRWREIAALNPRVNPDKLVLGQELVLPASANAKAAAPAPKPKAGSAKPAPVLVADAKPSEPARRNRGSKVK